MSGIPICVKTPKGIEEVELRTHRLPMRARQVLIMVDGKRDFTTLLAMFPGDALEGICRQLIDEGFIVARAKPVAPVAVTAPPPVAPPVDDAQRLTMARNFMNNTLSAFVGVAASSLSVRVERAPGIDDLRHLFGEWRESIALVRDGRERLPELESKLAALLS